jgi:2-polyprenyl-6-methoxyphenol hydroxylase-like FAD-dependent oxidoreductase
MRRIVVVGAGQAGLLLALGLKQNGYDVTVVAERTAEALRGGRLISNACVFAPGLAHERRLGVDFWNDEVPWVSEVAFFGAGEPGEQEPGISWLATLDEHAESVDQRIKMAAWLDEFARIGGEIRIASVTPDELEPYTREFDLVLVAAGRGPQFADLFKRNAELSRFSTPQRALSAIYLEAVGEDPFPMAAGVNFGLSSVGECFALPVLSTTGPVVGLGFFGIPGGPLDVWDDVTDQDQHFELAHKLLSTHFPWLAGITANGRPAGPLDTITGRVTPVVRDAVGTLPSGAKVLAMGDAAVTNDPVGGQGANMATRCAAVYQDAILEHGDKPFDEEFMSRSFDRFWAHARHATRFNSDLLEPPPPHVVDTLIAAQTIPEVAQRFAQLFPDPAGYEGWLTDPEASARFLSEARARA